MVQLALTGSPTTIAPPGKFGSLWILTTSPESFANLAPTAWLVSMMIEHVGEEPHELPSPSQSTRKELENGLAFNVTVEFVGKMPQQPVHPKNVSLRQSSISGVLVTIP